MFIDKIYWTDHATERLTERYNDNEQKTLRNNLYNGNGETYTRPGTKTIGQYHQFVTRLTDRNVITANEQTTVQIVFSVDKNQNLHVVTVYPRKKNDEAHGHVVKTGYTHHLDIDYPGQHDTHT